MIISFPWPSQALSPNARVHWSQKARAAKKYKMDCYMLCKAAKLTKIKAEEVNLAVIFSPPDERRRDCDNAISSIKACLDAISEAIGIDDSKFECTYVMSAPRKHGTVTVEITWKLAEQAA